MNINRDYLIINDVKKSNVKLDNGSIFFYITDKNTQNIFVNLVINVSNNDLIQKYANIENAENYTLIMNIVKPSNTYKVIEGKLHDKENAIFEFNLNEDCCDEIGPYRCELLTKCIIDDHEEITTSNKLTYKVKSSVLNDLDDIVEVPEYPLVIQLFDKLSDIEQYEEDRRANEVARQLAEQQRQARFDKLNADIDNKMVDVENRISAKEEAVDTLIADTKADIDEYKTAKDQEIDDYKTAKDTEINNAITAQDNKINEFINEQNNRLDAIEAKNQQQDDRLLDIEKINNRQDIDIKCLYGASQTIDVTKEGNSIYLQNSNNGFTIIDEIKGNTLVNCNKEVDKELILNGNINTSGDNTVTITEGVDGGLVDVALEGNTLVNVSKTKDSTAITKAYTVENSGNHIALQGDVDGSCRPVIAGNTLWIDNDTEEVLTAFDETKNLRLQSSFEDNLVTQEMVDSGEEVADNLGKYKVEYKSTREDSTVGNTKTLYLNSPLLEGDTIEEKDGGIYHVHRYEEIMLNGTEAWNLYSGGNAINEYPVFYYNMPNVALKHLMICDKIPVIKTIDGNCGEFAIGPHSSNNSIRLCIELSKLSSRTTDALKEWLQSNPITVVYQLVEPTYELIEQSNLEIPSYTNGHLDFDTAVPVEKVEFKPFSEELTYLYANTQYTVQFISDKAITADITLGGAQLLAQSIVQGLNRIAITTPATLVDNKLVINGVGAKISEVVVTNTDREFGYFEGMKSVGECEELEVKGITRNLFDGKWQHGYIGDSDGKLRPYPQSGKSTLNYIPIRYGKTYTFYCKCDIGISCRVYFYDKDFNYIYAYSVNSGIKKTQTYSFINTNAKAKYIKIRLYNNNSSFNTDNFNNILIATLCKGSYAITENSAYNVNTQQLTHEPLRAVGDAKDRYVLIDGKWYIERNCDIREYQEGDIDTYKTDLINTIYPLTSPIYEPLDHNPLEVYSDITHITTNSTIPTNITVKNHGFNCLLKPSTTYTISSNLGLNTVTTPSTLTEDCLRFMDTDTSDITTMKDVLILEGDWTTKANAIPANFSGIESAFEQEYDAEKGKYKVNIKVANEDKSEENNITFYINEPLRGIDDVKDKVYVKDNKVVVQRNCGIRAYEDGDFGTYLTDKVNTVYQLAEPTYEEVEYNDAKLFIESFKSSTLFYNSNVPVTSAVHYSYSVPIVDTVAQAARISDEQDVMIIDLATQVAVMEMLLM